MCINDTSTEDVSFNELGPKGRKTPVSNFINDTSTEDVSSNELESNGRKNPVDNFTKSPFKKRRLNDDYKVTSEACNTTVVSETTENDDAHSDTISNLSIRPKLWIEKNHSIRIQKNVHSQTIQKNLSI